MPSKDILKKYRLLPLIGVGAVVLVVLVLLSMLIWAIAAYAGQNEPAQSGGAAAVVIYLAAVFISCAVMTLLIRGGTVIPSAVLGLLASVASLLLAPDGAGFGKALLKILLTLIVAVAGFALAKLCCQFFFPDKKQPQPTRQKDRLSSWEEKGDAISEPGK